MSWDENLEPEEMRRCMELEKAFRQQNVIKVSRWTPQECSEIHIFVDASQRAVELAVYSRRSNSTPGEPKLIYGKTRLVPKRESRNKSASIPRLELLAVTIGVRVLEFIKQEIYVEKTYLWTDSACVLHWLRKPPIVSKYISNRIDEIKRSKDIEFCHVRSACNPADLASRGLFPEKLIESSLWWNGLSWLSKPKERWPEDEIMEENIMSVCTAMGLMEEETIQSEQEYDRATQLIVKMAQLNTTRKEIEHWGSKKDQNGIWRCVGRLRRTMPEIEDFPCFINRGKFAELIVKHYHEKSFRASVLYTWSKMRERYWIPHGRSYIKKILRKICKGCTMRIAKPFEQPDFSPCFP
uniref:Integrase zinc-binding domain-containing protein n=1 Tax=Wuchereria bancrofti TaxID=6293 RepID=A0AAF5PWB6_WUCBA